MKNRSAIVLIVAGALLLAHNFDLLRWEWLHQWWPLLLIALGLWSLVSHGKADNEKGGQAPTEPKP